MQKGWLEILRVVHFCNMSPRIVQIAEVLNVNKKTMQGRIARLEAAGLVKVHRSRSVSYVTLTKDGEDYIASNAAPTTEGS